MANAGPVRDWIMSKCSRAALAPDGLGMQIFQAVDSGELTELEAGMLVRSFLSAGIDTTVYGLGNALYCFATPSRAVEHASRKPQADPRRLRGGAALRGAGADLLPDHHEAGRGRPASASATARRCCCFSPPPTAIRAAGTGPIRSTSRRRATGHMTFGTGIHGCVGQAVARLESEADPRRAREARRLDRARRRRPSGG